MQQAPRLFCAPQAAQPVPGVRGSRPRQRDAARLHRAPGGVAGRKPCRGAPRHRVAWREPCLWALCAGPH